jgi:hypothetical protein
MSKPQTDIRTTSYDVHAARPFGYEGTLDDVLAQIREEKDSMLIRLAPAEMLIELERGKHS